MHNIVRDDILKDSATIVLQTIQNITESNNKTIILLPFKIIVHRKNLLKILLSNPSAFIFPVKTN